MEFCHRSERKWCSSVHVSTEFGLPQRQSGKGGRFPTGHLDALSDVGWNLKRSSDTHTRYKFAKDIERSTMATSSNLPPTPAAVSAALLPWLGTDLLAEIDVSTASGTAVARLMYEVSAALAETGMAAKNIGDWWSARGGLNGVGVDGSPIDTLRYESLKEASDILRAATHATAQAWPVRTLILLDVDGVILPYSDEDLPRPDSLHPIEIFHPPYAKPLRFHYDPSVIEAIKRWAAMAAVEVHWLTTWGQLAPDLLAPQIGLPALPLFAERTPIDEYRNIPWKRRAVQGYVEEFLLAGSPARLVWIDDFDASGADKRLREMRNPGLLVDSLVVQPASHLGLTSELIRQVDAFLAKPRPGTA